MICQITLDEAKRRLYALGKIPPNYPVPSTMGAVVFNGYADMVYIDHPDGDDYFMCWHMWNGAMLIHRND